MTNPFSEELMRKRNMDFSSKCLEILNKYVPNIQADVTVKIITEIAVARLDMEVQHAHDVCKYLEKSLIGG